MKRELRQKVLKASGLLADNTPKEAATLCISKKMLKKQEALVFRIIIPE